MLLLTSYNSLTPQQHLRFRLNLNSREVKRKVSNIFTEGEFIKKKPQNTHLQRKILK